MSVPFAVSLTGSLAWARRAARSRGLPPVCPPLPRGLARGHLVQRRKHRHGPPPATTAALHTFGPGEVKVMQTLGRFSFLEQRPRNAAPEGGAIPSSSSEFVRGAVTVTVHSGEVSII